MKELYDEIRDEVSELLSKFDSTNIDEDQYSIHKEVTESLLGLKNRTNEDIDELKKNSEWGKFTIAFYGETGAGKSTLIEVLCILLNHSTKAEQRKLFSEIKEQADVYLNKKQVLQVKIQQYEEEIKNNTVLLEENAIIKNNLINTIKAERWISFSNTIIAIFHQLGSQKKYYNTLKEISNQKKHIKVLQTYQKSIQNDINKIDRYYENEKFEQKMQELADGRIIGDGSSDFTKNTQHYEFSLNENKFLILDVPGIEGNESMVKSEIDIAVQKAHAVFYVGKDATIPQSGILEKIKKHLHSQSEVYYIYNKPVPTYASYNRLGESIISNDEKASIEKLDIKMREELENVYEKNIVLSAYIAFLAVANCVGTHKKQQDKFFNDDSITIETLLSKTKIDYFVNFLTNDLLVNYKEKIKKANYRKIGALIEDAQKTINDAINQYKDFCNLVKKEEKGAKDLIDNSKNSFIKKLGNDSEKIIANFIIKERECIYDKIDGDFDNDDFKYYFKKQIEQNTPSAISYIKEAFTQRVDEFKEDVSETVEKFKENIEDFVDIYDSEKLKGSDFQININLGDSLKMNKILFSVAGSIASIVLIIATTNWWNPVGWTAMGLTVIAGIVSIVKAVREFFSKSYRRSNQRKKADEALDNLKTAFLGKIKELIKETSVSVDKNINSINDSIEKTSKDVVYKLEYFSKASDRLNNIAKKIEKQEVISYANK